MDLTIKFIFYLVIISSQVDDLLSRPVTLLNPSQRLRRQVVQPKWLTNPDFSFIDPNVHVTDQNLKETAALREAIQKAVNAGTFFVSVPEGDPSIPTIESSDSDANRPPPPAPFPSFDFSQFDFSNADFEFFNAEQREALVRGMLRLWEEFVKGSRTLFNLQT